MGKPDPGPDAAKPAERAPPNARVGGRYRIEDVLAEGGMGAVYRVVDERTGAPLALKRMRGADASTPHLLALFEREYRTLAGLSHPRIIRAYDYGVDNVGPYYTMELAPGRDLHQLAPLPVKEACRHLRDVATCLALLHTRKLIHRDVTPRNVRVLDSGECKLIDFGALMSFGIPEGAVGTPPCIPPEALRRGPLDQRADIFSLGALMYWTLTRKHAYPARRIEDLPLVWRTKPTVPSKLVPGLSTQLDALVMRLLSLDPLARPATMAEVVEQLNVLGQLPPEDAETQRALGESYLAQASFVGRQEALNALQSDLAALADNQGRATLVTGVSGVGRSRLLREAIVQAQLDGVRCYFVDAQAHRGPNGTAIAIVHQLLDASPAARREASTHAESLAQLDRGLAERLGLVASAPKGAMSGDWRARIQELLLAIVTAASNEERLLLVVDNVDDADDGSLAMLAGLLRLTTQGPLALLMSVPSEGPARTSMSWQILYERSSVLTLEPLSDAETLTLARSLFGEAPNLNRFAEWLHEHTGGLPLHCMELARRLFASGEIRYLDGMWALPPDRPASLATDDLRELLAARLPAAGTPALAVAEALAVQRGALSRARCKEVAEGETDQPFVLLDELVRLDVLEDSLDGYRFTHGVLRQTLLDRMSEDRRRQLHLRCAEWELKRAERGPQMFARIEAGWHLLQAGEESRGADTLATVTFDTVGMRFAFADLQIAAPALEAALLVYQKQNRSLYERLPLMAALAQAGYYEDRVWGERYGDAALDAVQEVSGLYLARRLQRFLGKTLGLILALLFAFVRFSIKGDKRYGFKDVLVQLFGVVTTMTGAASIALDVKRAEQVAATLEPFLHLHERITPVGIGQFCAALKEIGRDNQARAVAVWTTLLEHFNDPKYYPTLPKNARPLYIGGLWFARGVFETMRDGRGALLAADALDALGLKLYRMIASSLRALYYANRGQLEQARLHREQVDVHAIQIGSAWQVELWEPAAMILVHATIGDVIEMRRVSDRLAVLSKKYPSLALHAKFSEFAVTHARDLDESVERSPAVREAMNHMVQDVLVLFDAQAPRSFVGWAATGGYIARSLNVLERHRDAKELADRVLSHMEPGDRAFVALYLGVEIERAVAEAGLGDSAGAKRRLDELLEFHKHSDNPLTRGRLHEAYARVAAHAEDWPNFRHHLAETRSWFRGTGTPVLLARVDRLQALDPHRSVPPAAREGMPTLRGAGRDQRSTAPPAQSGTAAIDPNTEDVATVALIKHGQSGD
ncbi:MAG TPA: AAA family ATPase [Polyangiales bacterium]|nr:AAA family ATPase [Polyangiales bacterium]